ncbi:hypothetical protein EW145_g3733 [Phellinidium pouzarii]|uniref:Sec39 domain-containing protein n=1 Tax=Phellinidium pouzarii TaxID=167371 RepID=A0A4S4L6A8_9AGAM|nr:hypothetical protein EW145_g3733 [Phellinidium pouzarii]
MDLAADDVDNIAGFGRISLALHGCQAIFSELSYRYPLKLLSPRVSEPSVAIAYVLTYGGGLVSGDRIDLHVKVASGAALLLLTQGSTKVFKHRAGVRLAKAASDTEDMFGLSTVQKLNVDVQKDGLLLLLPDPVTCFSDAAYNQIQAFHLEEGASAALLDWVTSGRMSRGEEWQFSRYYSVNEVWLGKKRIARDVLLLEEDYGGRRALKDRIGIYSCYATLILCGPKVRTVVDSLYASYHEISIYQLTTHAELIWSMSGIEGGCVVRIAGKETEGVKKWIRGRIDAELCARWTALDDNDLTEEHIEQLLYPLQDDLWTAAACIDRVLDDVDVQRALLDLGIQRTDSAIRRAQEVLLSHTSSSANSNDSERRLTTYFSTHVADAQLCQMRTVLLNRRDRLRSYEEIKERLLTQRISHGFENDAAEGWEDDPWADADPDESSLEPSPSTAPLPLPLSVFLSEDMTLISLALASQMKLEALLIIRNRHFGEIFPYRFEIIDRIPSFVDPSTYRDLLPAHDMQIGMERIDKGNPWRVEDDFSETNIVKSALSETGLPFLIAPDKNQIYSSGLELLSSDEVQTWYKNKVEAVVSSTGMVDMALSLVQHGASQGVVGLDELGEDLSLLSRLVYDSPGSEKFIEPVNMSKWLSLEPHDVILQYLAHSIPETIVSDIRRLVMPYLFVLESRCERAGNPDPELLKRLLYDYILHAHHDTVVPIFESSKPTLVASQRFISDDEDLARLALACLYGSSSLDDWANMSRIFECLPAWSFEADDDDDEADTTVASLGAFLAPSTSRLIASPSDLLVFFKPLPARSLSHALDILDVHLESGEILARWGVPVPLRWFLQSTYDEAQQRAWAMKMARQVNAPSGDLDSEDIWLSLLEDMLKLTRHDEKFTHTAFGALSGDDIRQIFFRGILSTGKFTIAKHVILPRQGERLLDTDVIERLCLDCSREFYDNASSGKFNSGDMKLAYDCLGVAPQSPAVEKERKFIEATSRISSFNLTSRPGVPILPIEIRLTKDKLSLVAGVLSSNESAYKHVEVILELAHKLGFQNDVLAEVKTLAMIADAALQAEDFLRAFEASERMVNAVLKLRQTAPLGADNPQVREAVDVCWVACFQLGRQSEAKDTARKMSLLGRALELCPSDKIVDILTSWRKLETEDIVRRQERNSVRQSRNENGAKQARGRTSTLSSRLQGLHVPSPALPSASALASHTFSRVAASLPFSMHGNSSGERNHSQEGSPDVQSQARHALQRGIGWLIGAEEDEL